MSTLSLDLRGVDATHVLRQEAPTRSAGISALLHSAVLGGLLASPLLQSITPPEVAAAIAPPLPRPIMVALPPAPRPPAPARRIPSSAKTAQVTAPTPSTPTEVPTTLNVAARFDFVADPVPDRDAWGDADPTGVGEGLCPLGSLCGPAAAPVDVRPHGPVQVGGIIKEPRLIESRAPVYPPVARTAGVAGKVVLEALVGQDGRVRAVKITEGHPLFDEAAEASVRSRRYEPLLLNGVAMDFLVTITVTFAIRR